MSELEATAPKVVSQILSVIGPAVLLPVERGTKRPKLEGWPNFTLEQTNKPEYLAQFENGCNIGVLLGWLATIRIFRLDSRVLLPSRGCCLNRMLPTTKGNRWTLSAKQRGRK